MTAVAIAKGVSDRATDVVTFQITREALDALIASYNDAKPSHADGYIRLEAHEYSPGQIDLTAYIIKEGTI
jgi:hypothetical protein